ncbi:MAG: TonB family protein [Taibaiella sp.]|nr:TonB family protein [Taibaiella sp.]
MYRTLRIFLLPALLCYNTGIRAQTTGATKPALVRIQGSVIKPHFKGDMDAFIKANMHYPKDALRKHIQGTVRVYINVDTHGYIHNAEVTHHVCPSIDEEALRIIGLMPPWEPTMLKGKPTKGRLSIDIVFKVKK